MMSNPFEVKVVLDFAYFFFGTLTRLKRVQVQQVAYHDHSHEGLELAKCFGFF